MSSFRLLQQEENSPRFFSFLQNSYGAFVGYTVAVVFSILILTCFVREVCYRRYGIEVCPGAAGSARARERRRQILEDERAAMELQQDLERESRREASAQRRSERRAKYQVFLKPFTMVIEEKDFYTPPQAEGEVCPSESMEDIETGSIDSHSSMPNEEALNDTYPFHQERHVLVTLPVDREDGTPRRVDASCSICLMEYEEGDAIIWATRKLCQHAFHEECILTWLSKGKKRCPCCRHLFVPGSSVDDKDVIVDDQAPIEEDEEDGNESDEVSESEIIEQLRSFSEPGSSPRRRSLESMAERRHDGEPDSDGEPDEAGAQPRDSDSEFVSMEEAGMVRSFEHVRDGQDSPMEPDIVTSLTA